MLRNVLLKTIRDQRRALLGWSLGIVGVAVMYAAFYPSIRDNAGPLNEYVQNLPEAIRGFIGEGTDFASPVGYLQTELFSIFGPLLLLVYAIGAGSRAIAGEEEAKTLDLLLSTPIPRTRVVWHKFGSMVVGSLILGIVLWAALVALGPPFDLDVALADLGAACVMTALLALTFGSIALLLGAATGSRGLAIGLTSALAAATYIVNALAPAVDVLDRIRWISPFYFAIGTEPLANGFDVLDLSVLVVIGAAAFAATLWVFDRRDLAA